jgi:hypothetical protein
MSTDDRTRDPLGINARLARLDGLLRENAQLRAALAAVTLPRWPDASPNPGACAWCQVDADHISDASYHAGNCPWIAVRRALRER